MDQNTELDALDRKILETAAKKKHLVVINKMDLEEKLEKSKLRRILGRKKPVKTSALTKEGIEQLKEAMFETLAGSPRGADASELVLTNLRHEKSMEKARDQLREFLGLLERNEYPEILSIELRNSMNSLGEITGEVTTEDLLGRIFSRFCIGQMPSKSESKMFHVKHFTNRSVQTRGTNRIVFSIIELFKGVRIQSWKSPKFHSQSINKKKCFISVN